MTNKQLAAKIAADLFHFPDGSNVDRLVPCSIINVHGARITFEGAGMSREHAEGRILAVLKSHRAAPRKK